MHYLSVALRRKGPYWYEFRGRAIGKHEKGFDLDEEEKRKERVAQRRNRWRTY